MPLSFCSQGCVFPVGKKALPQGLGSHSEYQETGTLCAELMDPLCVGEKGTHCVVKSIDPKINTRAFKF